MGDTIRSILDFLHRHHFTKAEAALRSEISARQQVTAGFSWPVVDDWDSDDLTLQLSAQEKANLVENGSLDTEMVYMDMELQRLRMKASQEQANLEKKRNGLQWKTNNMDVFQAASFLEFEVKEVKGQDNNLGLQQGFQFNKVNASQQKQGMLELVENDLVFSSPKEAQAKMNGDNSVKFTPRVQEVFTAPNCSERVQNFYNGNPDDFCSDVEVKGSPSMVAKDNRGKLGFDSGLEDEGIILIMPDEEMDEIFEIKKLGECQDVRPAEVTHGHVGKQKRHKKVAAVQEIVYQEQCPQEYGNCQLEKAVIVQENYGIRGGKFSENKVSDPGLLQLFPEETGGQSGDTCRRSGNGIPIKTCMPFSHSFFHESGFPGLGNLEGQEQQRGNTGKVSQNLARTHPEECLELSNKVRACESSPNGRGDIPKTMEGAVDAEAEVQEIFPRLPPVKLRSCDEVKVMHRDSKGIIMEDQQASTVDAVDPSGDFLGSSVFVDGETTIAGCKRPGVCRRSVSQGISEDTFGLFTGFERSVENSAAECLEDHWESDTYDDDDDPGYHRQPIEDEAWFLAHEIDYPSDDERGKSGMELHPGNHDKEYEEDHTELQFSGEEYYKLMNENVRNVGGEQGHGNPNAIFIEDMYERMGSQSQNFSYDESNLDANLMQADQAWQGYTEEETYLEEEGDEKLIHDRDRTEDDSVEVDDERHGSLGIGINSDVADFGSELRENLNGGSSEGDPESFLDHQINADYGSSIGRFGQTSSSHDIGEVGNHHDDQEDEHDTILKYYNEAWGHRKWAVSRHEDESNMGKLTNGENGIAQRNEIGGFSFPSPSSTADLAGSRADSTKDVQSEDIDEFAHGPDDTLAFWKCKSNHSSPLGQRDTESSCLPPSCFPSLHEKREEEGNEEDGMIRNQEATEATAVEDEEMAAMQEHIRRFQSDEEEFETFNLRVVHRKNRTGFEEDKEFPVVINSIIAGRYHVTEYLGSAAFSRAIQAHDLNTGMDVCMKIIKNNKDFFDQSLDEIKLLKYINRHDPADKHHLLRLYDYFYHREHLFIVCELLRANLYEFHKYNRESGGEVYFTMPRLQSITRQCLEALDFLHGLGLMHCDLKPENILVKSYSRCEIKVIDLGSSCFQTDHLCSYVQSRSYRAPEVILGLSYDQKIDVWSLGCILAELCTGNVLFQNDSLASLLARVIGIIGPIDPEMLAKGRDSYKYFTKNHMLYERNPETDQLEYLIPKKTTLAHRLPMGDEGFVEFVAYLLQINPVNRPSAAEALQHPWLSYPYEPISS